MKKIIVILILIFIILSIFNVNASSLTFPLIGKKIYIDPGHGSVDIGTSNQGIKEKDLNLQISLELKNTLNKEGATVLLTRNADYDLSKPGALYRKKSDFDNRINLINNSQTDIYLSIHQNHYSNPKYHGPQVFYSKANDANLNLAQTIQKHLNNLTKTSREIKEIPKTYMYDKLNPPGVLIECGFISNPQELKKLTNKEYQSNLAKAITNALINYYN